MRLYLSYRRTDGAFVAEVTEALKALGQDVWSDQQLLPGASFDQQIVDNLREADFVVAFISKASASGVQQPKEIGLAQRLGKTILPVRLDDVNARDLPFAISDIQWLSLYERDSAADIARSVVDLLSSRAQNPAGGAHIRDDVAADIAGDLRREIDAPQICELASKSVFVVHGHDDAMMDDVCSYLRSEGVEPIVLKRLKGGQNTLFDKFRTVGGQARFAVVLVSADDFGASLGEYEEASDRALRFRPRQNVILELGFFFGKLGWDDVFVLMKAPPKKVPPFDMPSDLAGVIYEPYNERGEWKEFLRTQLSARKLI